MQAGDDADSMISTGGSRATLCVSSEVGCQMGCTFCATGTMGLKVSTLPKVAILQTQAYLRIEHTRASLCHGAVWQLACTSISLPLG